MAKLLVKPNGEYGRVTHVTPKSAGWTYVGFDLHKMAKCETVGENSGSREVCLVFLTGAGSVQVDGVDFGQLGGRKSVFEGPPTAVYVPSGSDWTVKAESELELAVCSAPGFGKSGPARTILPDSLSTEIRGKGNNTRYVTNILPEGEPADSLLVVEVITPAGNTSSYPPHKHDEDNLPDESLLEETYYHRINPPQGFAFQRVYTDDRSLDEAMAVEDGDVVLVPKGYHPTATCHGYDLYYLNVMAGPTRTWKFNNAKEHEWLFEKA